MKRILLLSVVICVLLAACDADPTPLPNPSPVSTLISPQITPGTIAPARTRTAVPPGVASPVPATRRGPGGSIVIAGVGAPSREITKLPEFVTRALFDSLLRADPEDGHLLPGLAERWLVSEDAKTFVFILREDIKFSDGTPLTAQDVAFTLTALSNPDIRVNPAADFGAIDQITATDTRTISVTFKEPYCAALTYIATVPILPKHILEEQDLRNVSADDLIGTGPLVLEEWQDNSLTFTRNANYWNGAPQIVNWTFENFDSEAAAQSAVLTKQANVTMSATGLNGVQNTTVAVNAFYALAFNLKRAPFDDLTMRQALSMAINRPALADAQPRAGNEIASSVLPDFWAAAAVQQPAFNVAQARQMLATAGWRDTDGDGILEKDGKRLEMTLWVQGEDAVTEQTAQFLRSQLAQVGAHAVLKVSDRILYLTRVFLHEYDLALVHFNIPLDPDQHYFWGQADVEPGFGLNVTGFTNSALESALNVANRVPRCDLAARKKAYAPVWQEIAHDTPMLFLFAPTRVLNSSPTVTGIGPSSFAGAFWNLNTWEISP